MRCRGERSGPPPVPGWWLQTCRQNPPRVSASPHPRRPLWKRGHMFPRSFALRTALAAPFEKGAHVSPLAPRRSLFEKETDSRKTASKGFNNLSHSALSPSSCSLRSHCTQAVTRRADRQVKRAQPSRPIAPARPHPIPRKARQGPEHERHELSIGYCRVLFHFGNNRLCLFFQNRVMISA